MKQKRTPQRVLAEVAAIKRMERGRTRTIQRHTGYEYYILSAYENGKTVNRYVRKGELAELKTLTAAYERFKALVQEYEEMIVQKTRQEREAKPSR